MSGTQTTTGDAARKRIAVLHARIVRGAGGGPEKTILNSPRHLDGTRWREIALYLHAPGDPGIAGLAERARAANCPFFALDDRWPIDFGTLRRIAELCRRENVRVWHGHDYKSNLYGILLRKKLGLRLVTTVHGWVEKTARTPLYWAVDRWCLRRYERVVAVSADLEQECLRIGVPRAKLARIENAIDAGTWRRHAPAASSVLRGGLPTGRLVVGAVGRLSPEKGFDLLIEAVRGAVARGADFVLWIAGEGPERARLDALAQASRGRVLLLGQQPDPRALFETFDVYALSSLREGLPNVVLEAMAMEVPIVATRSGGVEHALADGEDALLVAPGSARELEDALVRLAGDPALRARLARAARERVERDFSFATRMQRYAALYEDLLPADPASPART